MKFWRVLPVLLLLSAAPVAANEAVSVTVDDGLIDVDVTAQVPVADVLTAIAEQFSASVEGAPDGQAVGPVRLVRVSLRQALSELLPKRSFTLKYPEGSDEPSDIIIAGGAKQTASTDIQPPEQNIPQLGAPKFRNGFAGGLPDIAKGNPLLNTPQANPLFQQVAECGRLLKQPENRGKKSETLVTAKGQPCPPGIIVAPQ